MTRPLSLIDQNLAPLFASADDDRQGGGTTAGAHPTTTRLTLSMPPSNSATSRRAVRGHRGIENRLHYVLDVRFGEDQCRVRKGHAAQNFSRIRRIALNLLRREITKKRGIKGNRLNAAWDHNYLLRLLTG